MGRPSSSHFNAAAVTVLAAASLFVGTAAPAGVAAQQPASSSPSAVATAARYVHVRDGRFTLDTRDAEAAGALAAGTSLVASLNTQLAGPEPSAGIVLDAAQASATQTFTLLPGVTLIVSSTKIQLNMTKEAVTETQDVLGLSQGIASLVGSILGLIPEASPGGPIASVVASSIGVGSDLFKFCIAPDGSASFTIPLTGIPIPSCSGLTAALA